MKARFLPLVCLFFCFAYMSSGCKAAHDDQDTESARRSSESENRRCKTAPTDLTAVVDGILVNLTWVDHSRHESGFRVERKSGTDPFAAVATVGRNVTTYSETVAPGTYTYRVEALEWKDRERRDDRDGDGDRDDDDRHGNCEKRCFSNEVTVTVTVTPPEIAGTMSYALAPMDAETASSIVIAGTSGVTIGKFVLSAQGEDLMQDRLRVSLVQGASAVSSVFSLSLYDGSTLIAGPVTPDAAGNADFADMNLGVPDGGSKTITVKADVNTIPTGIVAGLLPTAVPGTNLMVGLDLTDPAAGTFRYHGLTTGGEVTTISAYDDVTTFNSDRDKIVRRSKPVVSLASLPISTLSNGLQTISRFTITADAAGDVSLMTVSFRSTLQDAGASALTLSLSAFRIREMGQATEIPLTEADVLTETPDRSRDCTAPIMGTIVCDIRITFLGEQVITAGTSKSYELLATVAGADDAGDAISTTLPEEDSPRTSVFAGLTGELQSNRTRFFSDGTQFAPNVVWSDLSAGLGHNDTPGALLGIDNPEASNDWTTGRLVPALPLDAQVMAR